jgi:hypothetical protein
VSTRIKKEFQDISGQNHHFQLKLGLSGQTRSTGVKNEFSGGFWVFFFYQNQVRQVDISWKIFWCLKFIFWYSKLIFSNWNKFFLILIWVFSFNHDVCIYNKIKNNNSKVFSSYSSMPRHLVYKSSITALK